MGVSIKLPPHALTILQGLVYFFSLVLFRTVISNSEVLLLSRYFSMLKFSEYFMQKLPHTSATHSMTGLTVWSKGYRTGFISTFDKENFVRLHKVIFHAIYFIKVIAR